jgi:hypothetical protein
MKRDFASLFPRKSGCYIIRYRDVVLYIGQAVELKERWYKHHHKSFIEVLFPDASIEIVLCDIDMLTETEKNLISTLRPIWNGVDKMTISNMLGDVPSDWYEEKPNLEDWIHKEERRYEKMKACHKRLMSIKLEKVVLH